jgi:very-short-patch-repair endonuclease
VYCGMCKHNVERKKKYAERAIKKDAIKFERLMGIDPVHEERFYKAKKVVEKTGDYAKATEKAFQAVNKYGSIPEAIAAIILISCGIKIIPQAKIYDRKRADFLLPDKKAILEIDGITFHADKNKQYCRDEVMTYVLGNEWKVLHYSAERIRSDPKAFKRYIIKHFAKPEEE